ncbi:glycosyltransferase [Desulfurococcus mucosus]|uniref:Glycosyl transferase group 1 n=1 Tax=Desulfurococcus mucosus (strain ATCC 35584 / DSM 2162 / JCM 9187 / O7/1) TaxID=765177 RepID=E8R9N1_DESM0|nr:glycosyltransferase [Desulfurococcus mucosus]ADV65207.1 glycosyl transferase group 1 [Desulfurococcus mucosus DSM 2162]
MTKRVKAVVGPFTTIVGGAELVKAEASRVLCNMGYSVVLAGLTHVELRHLPVDVSATGCMEFNYLLPWFPQALGLYQVHLASKAVEKAIRLHRPCLVFIDSEGSRVIDGLKERMGFKLVKYIHFPHSLYLATRNCSRTGSRVLSLYCRDALSYSRKYFSSMFWRTYWATYLKVLESTLPENPFQHADLVMVNSEYTRDLLRELYGVKARVVYPPVHIEDLLECGRKGFNERDNSIVMVGRISSEKRHDDVIKAVGMLDDKPVVRVIGALTRGNLGYLAYLRKLASKHNVRLEVYFNAPRRTLAETLCSSKALVHAAIGEHFGIAVVEAMAAGAPVIVNRESGSYRDILGGGYYGLGYSSIEELSESIYLILHDSSLWTKYHELSRHRSISYDSRVFDELFSKEIHGLGGGSTYVGEGS